MIHLFLRLIVLAPYFFLGMKGSSYFTSKMILKNEKLIKYKWTLELSFLILIIISTALIFYMADGRDPNETEYVPGYN